MDSPKRAPDAMLSLKGATQEAFKEACASLENRALAGGPPNADQAVSEAPATEITVDAPLQARWSSLIIPNVCKARLPNKLMLGSYVKLMEWGCPSMTS